MGDTKLLWTDPEIYVDKNIFDAEQARIFKNVWMPVCHESELPDPYDFRTSSIANENVLVCRAPDDKINAFLNVCPHRGMLIERRPQGTFLEGQASGNPKRITCMFHAWQFDMRGNCVYVAREKEGYQDRFSKDEAGLRRLRCEVDFGGFVWVNLCDQPPVPLRDWLNEPFEHLLDSISGEPLEVFSYRKSVSNSNFKQVHDDLIALHTAFANSEKTGDHSRPGIEVRREHVGYGHAVTGTFALKNSRSNFASRGLTFPGLSPDDWFLLDIFPGFTFSLHGSSMHTTTITPINPSEVMVEYRGLGLKTDCEESRAQRIRDYNAIWSPFGLSKANTLALKAPDRSEIPEDYMSHYYEEWARWMDRHPKNELRLVPKQTTTDLKNNQSKKDSLNKESIVVIGASHAGISFCDKARKNGYNGRIIVLDKQKGGPMERPPLSKTFLLDDSAEGNTKFLLRQKKWYRTNEIELRTRTSVEKIDLESKTLSITDGESVSFDKLVIAAGATPRHLPTTLDMENAFVLRQPDQAVAIRQKAEESKHVVIIGGGYIGLEVAASLRKKKLDVTVIEAAPRILARVASQPLAEHIHQMHVDAGVKISVGIGVSNVIAVNGKFDAVELSSGEVIKGDMLLVGIGVLPDSKLALSAGLETQREDGGSILVDSGMRTSHEDVMAIGDVAICRDQAIAVESVHNAQETAAIAAATITGVEPPRRQTPWFWSDQYDTKLQSVGIVPVMDPDVFQVERRGKRDGSVSFWSFRGNELVAVEVINDPATYMEARQCLDTQRFPDPELVSNPAFSLVGT